VRSNDERREEIEAKLKGKSNASGSLVLPLIRKRPCAFWNENESLFDNLPLHHRNGCVAVMRVLFVVLVFASN
jgi:hypothetical protein